MPQGVVIDFAASACRDPFLIETVQTVRITHALRCGQVDARIMNLDPAAPRAKPDILIQVERVALAVRYRHYVDRRGLRLILMRPRIEDHQAASGSEPQPPVRGSMRSAPDR